MEEKSKSVRSQIHELEVGDKVIYSKYAGTEVKFNGEEVMIMDQRDILAIVK